MDRAPGEGNIVFNRSTLSGLLCASLVLVSFSTVSAQTAPPPAPAASATADQPVTNQFTGEYFTSDLTEVFRLRHIEGEGQGDVPAYTNFGFTKFIWSGHGVLMADLGARITNDADPGLTVGVHRRAIAGNAIVGGGLFYDLQEFQQGSVAFELFTRNWTFRSNGYLILGDDVESDSDYLTTPGTNIFFEGYSILADGLEQDTVYEVAMSGFDVEFARNIGWRATEAFVGSYYLNGEIGDDAFGGKAGLRGFLAPDLSANVTISGDDLFGVNVYGGFTWFVGARGGLSRPNIARRITLPVERNEQIVVNEVTRRTVVAGAVVLTFEDDAIEVAHVQAGAAGTNEGTFEDPFNALPDTQEADIVYVHADGLFVGQSYTLASDQRFLGEGSGNLHLVETDELGEIVLPDGNGGVNRPVIQASPGNAVTLFGDDNEVSNFAIQNAGTNGIFGDAVSGFDINRNVITGSGGRGIFLNNVSGLNDSSLVATGEMSNNNVSTSALQNIQIILAGDFDGEINDNVANASAGSNGIDISGDFLFVGKISGNTADGNSVDGIFVSVAAFDGDVSGNTTRLNGDQGIDFGITGNAFSDVDIENNTAADNTAEGISLLFSGTGTSVVEVIGNTLSGNNGGVDREFIAENEDAPGNAPRSFIELDGNSSANVLGAGPPFNYEFENQDFFADGEMFLELGVNIGTVEFDEDVEFGDFF